MDLCIKYQNLFYQNVHMFIYQSATQVNQSINSCICLSSTLSIFHKSLHDSFVNVSNSLPPPTSAPKTQSLHPIWVPHLCCDYHNLEHLQQQLPGKPTSCMPLLHGVHEEEPVKFTKIIYLITYSLTSFSHYSTFMSFFTHPLTLSLSLTYLSH